MSSVYYFGKTVTEMTDDFLVESLTCATSQDLACASELLDELIRRYNTLKTEFLNCPTGLEVRQQIRQAIHEKLIKLNLIEGDETDHGN